MQLDTRYDLMIYPTPPFNFEGTVYKPSHFPSSDNHYENGHYWQTMQFQGRVLGIIMSNAGTIDDPKVELSVFCNEDIPSSDLKQITSEIEYRFDMKADITEFYRDCRKD